MQSIEKIVDAGVASGVGKDDYIIYENRERLLAFEKEVEKIKSIVDAKLSYQFKSNVEKLRRLEDFSNKVIKTAVDIL